MQFGHGRAVLLAFASTTALFAASSAFAQATPSSSETTEVGEIVVTGTRTVGRSRLDTIAPVDVISGETLTKQGTGTELAAALAATAPSINFPRPAISDGSDHVRPATLRGLAPDQTLVLLNGQRGHVGALVNVNGNIGRGSTAFDLNSIPSISLASVEVLRDGASAQYGADAIAGVINLRLRQASSGGGVTANYGIYDTDFDTARGSHSRRDGEQTSVAGWVGLPLFGDGFLTLSGEAQKRQPTNRSDYAALSAVSNGSSNTVLGRFGDPYTEAYSGYFNAGKPLAGEWEAYAFGGYQHRKSESAATARAYNNSNNVTAIYPNGFLPIIAADIVDYNIYGGAKGPALGFDWDVSVGYGRNELDYNVLNSLNASYGAASQTQFYAGSLSYGQLTVDIDALKKVEVNLYEPLNVAFGVEYRREDFSVAEGEPTSYNKGPVATGGSGSQGFPGFAPSNAVDVDRHNVSAYLDLEGRFSEQFTVGVAGRYEDYSDFGDQFTGKMAMRYDFTPSFALRGSISTGFKSPALQQQYFSYVATNLVATQSGVVLQQNGTYRVNDPIAIALGAKPLEPETSTNYSAGAVYRNSGFELTLDTYRIEVDNRIIYSETLGVSRPSQPPASTTAIQALLAPYGVTGARFFLNGVNTVTSGVDVVGRYRTTQNFGRFDFTLAGNFNKTEVTRTPPVPSNLAIAPAGDFLFDRSSKLSFEQGTPEKKIVASVDWSLDDFGATLRGTSYDSVLVANNNATLDYETGDAVLVDIEGRYTLPFGVSLAVGVNNLTDEYPNATPTNVNGATGSVGFPSYSPYGFNGRFFYGRLSYSF
ncbi:TonB-dependent siderophore receptor [Brevundimonas sp. SORGH_AS_0993]|uniref:TonB-dependent receptor plug domain-containing protein n=1 Tax=Brevundimonas sp. SORGH_AS_0993 TaxID=3041794 RepID=UPI00278404E9|nr:TonB-dependent receptor [Brevundimonas sp. SORGH_AS_0993]MDQ1153209.1 iron complex outermembrane receptor protein [Brevundimonas sp. SORGH_AS_0993]